MCAVAYSPVHNLDPTVGFEALDNLIALVRGHDHFDFPHSHGSDKRGVHEVYFFVTVEFTRELSRTSGGAQRTLEREHWRTEAADAWTREVTEGPLGMLRHASS